MARQPLTRQPQFRAPIDKSNPLSRGLVSAILNPAFYRDVVSNKPITATSLVATPSGISFTGTNAVDFGLPGGLSTLISPSSSFTHLCLINVTDTGTTQVFVGDHATGVPISYNAALVGGQWYFGIQSSGGTDYISQTGTVTPGWHLVECSQDYDNGALKIYVDGVALTPMTIPVNTVRGAGGTLRLMGAGTLGPGVAPYLGQMAASLFWSRLITPAERKAYASNLWQLVSYDDSDFIAYTPETGGAGTTLTPGTGSLALSGFAPSVSQPKTVTPGPAALTITGYAPSVNQSTTLMPGAGALALTGYAPAVTQPKTLTPGAGALAISGFAPSVSQNVQLSPTPGALVITGRAPTISQPRTVSPGAGQLVVTGYAPSISQTYFVAPQVYAFTIMSDHAIDASVPALSGNINATRPLRASFNASTIMSAHPINGTGTISAKPINGTANLL